MANWRGFFGTASSTILLAFCVTYQSRAQAPEPLHIGLNDAIQRAKTNEVNFASASAAQRTAKIDAYLAKAGLLPSVTFHNQVLYTQPNGQSNQGGQAGVQASPIFIANNAVHEYVSQASINEKIGLKQFADASAASANVAKAAAELEVARRGLVSTVVTLYYSISASDRKQALLAQALAEAQEFTDMTRKREAAREVAHADVLKAQLQQQQKQRDLSDAVLAARKAKLELAVLLFADPLTPFATDPPSVLQEAPTHDEVKRLAGEHNPEIRSALAALQVANASVKSAKAAYLPDLALNFTYGIDAPQFAKRGPEDVRNLGYSISGTLDIPVWDWFSTQKKVQQAQIQHDVARVTLTTAQRLLVAHLEEAYAETVAAHDQLALLDESVRTAEESLRLTKLRYGAGESTALEVVDAQNAFLTAGTAQADGQVRYQTALAALQVLTGTI